jgi:hypothetical protein
MKRNILNDSGMNPTELDRILASEQPLIPSSGFLASVMESVAEEAAAPPPIPFPWKRIVPGVALVAGIACWGGVSLFRHGIQAVGQITMAAPHLPAAAIQPVEQAGWVALALGISLLSWLVSRRLAGR